MEIIWPLNSLINIRGLSAMLLMKTRPHHLEPAAQRESVCLVLTPHPTQTQLSFTTTHKSLTGQMDFPSAVSENVQESKDSFYVAERTGYYT